ncbi:MAG: shikimate kinase [Phyllobacterium sp.]
MNSQDEQAPEIATAASLREKLGRRSVVLVGLMGAGKSTVGRKLASMIGLRFLDADAEIETVSRMTIPELFEAYGEAEFRDLERRVIARILEAGPMVLATGGGAYMNEQTRRAIADDGISVWLKADLDVLFDRVGRRHNRPLLKTPDPRATLGKLLEDRYPVYAQAAITVMSRDEKKDVIAQEVIDALVQYLNMMDGTGQ